MMEERKYLIEDKGSIIARDMSLGIALLLLRALCEE